MQFDSRSDFEITVPDGATGTEDFSSLFCHQPSTSVREEKRIAKEKRRGDALSQIVFYADSQAFDVDLYGRPGRPTSRELLLSSVSYEVDYAMAYIIEGVLSGV